MRYRLFESPRFLIFYSAAVTLAFAAVVLCGAASLRNARFDILTARRINIVEPDGTVRLTISNKADFPGAWNRGKEYPRPDRRDAAGMLFMSEEGTEQGGLIWGAGRQPDGTIENHGHLSLDQYEENQVFAIDAGQDGKRKFSEISFLDQGDYPIEEKREANERISRMPVSQQSQEWDKFFSTHRHDVRRLEVGRWPDGRVGLQVRDHAGRPRLLLVVGADDAPTIQFLNSKGEITKEIRGSGDPGR